MIGYVGLLQTGGKHTPCGWWVGKLVLLATCNSTTSAPSYVPGTVLVHLYTCILERKTVSITTDTYGRRSPSLPAYAKGGASDRQQATGILSSRWRSTLSISGMKPTPAPKPPHTGAGATSRAMGVRQSSTTTACSGKNPAVARAGKIQQGVPVVDSVLERQKPPECTVFRAGIQTERALLTTTRDSRPRPPPADGVDLGILSESRSDPTELPRTESAPSSSAIIPPASSSSTDIAVYDTETRETLPDRYRQAGCPQPEPSPTRTAKNCWDESRDTIIPVYAATPPRNSGATKRGNQVAVVTTPVKQKVLAWSKSDWNTVATPGREVGCTDAPSGSGVPFFVSVRSA